MIKHRQARVCGQTLQNVTLELARVVEAKSPGSRANASVSGLNLDAGFVVFTITNNIFSHHLAHPDIIESRINAMMPSTVSDFALDLMRWPNDQEQL